MVLPTMPDSAYRQLVCRFDGSKLFIPFQVTAMKYSPFDSKDQKQAPGGVTLYCALCLRPIQVTKDGKDFETYDPPAKEPPPEAESSFLVPP